MALPMPLPAPVTIASWLPKGFDVLEAIRSC